VQRITITPPAPSHGRGRAVLCACVLLILLAGIAAAVWVIDGEKVYLNDSHVYLSAQYIQRVYQFQE